MQSGDQASPRPGLQSMRPVTHVTSFLRVPLGEGEACSSPTRRLRDDVQEAVLMAPAGEEPIIAEKGPEETGTEEARGRPLSIPALARPWALPCEGNKRH